MGLMQDHVRSMGIQSKPANSNHDPILHNPAEAPPPVNPLQSRYNELKDKIAQRRAYLQRINRPHKQGSYDGAINSMIAEMKRIESKINRLARLKS